MSDASSQATDVNSEREPVEYNRTQTDVMVEYRGFIIH